jgi:hypothetical protein
MKVLLQLKINVAIFISFIYNGKKSLTAESNIGIITWRISLVISGVEGFAHNKPANRKQSMSHMIQ